MKALTKAHVDALHAAHSCAIFSPANIYKADERALAREALAILGGMVDAPMTPARADVEHLRFMGEREISAAEVGEYGAHAEYGEELLAIAAKLAARLPPDQP